MVGGDFELDLLGVANYYPFGMQQPGRSSDAGNFWNRNAYNGMEKDDELKGKGNSYTTDFRQFDPRLARWLTQDPIFKEWESPYAGMGNNPVVFVDPMGLAQDDPNKNPDVAKGKEVGEKMAYQGTDFVWAGNKWSNTSPTSTATVTADKPKSSEMKGVDVKLLNPSENIKYFIKTFEGIKLNMYNDDAGHATIGWGHLIHKGPISGKESELPFVNGITFFQANYLFNNDLFYKAEAPVKRQVTVPLTQYQFDALISFTYNFNETILYNSTLLNRINSGNINEQSIRNMFSAYNKARDPKTKQLLELKGLTRRRNAEANIFLFGDYVLNRRIQNYEK
ncbi:MAG: hypothetical protein QG635_1753 [Bacteroidota bacterium]|nr:hypothetical protein [Bacteroidota bacterium]